MVSIMRFYPVQRLARPLRRHLERHSIRVARSQVSVLRAEILGDRRVAELQSELASLRTDHHRRIGDFRSEADAVRHDRELDAQRLKDLTTDLAAARQSLDEFVAQKRAAQSNQPAVDDHVRELAAVVEGFRCSLHLLLGPTGRYLTRLVSDDELERLISEFEGVSDREQVVVAVHQAYRTLIELELRCVGRFAGSTSNVLARLAAVALMPPPSGEVLEIGTLFGVGAVGVARQLARIGFDAHLTLIDPFAGYQIQPDRGHDIDVSLTPATRAVVTTNLALGGVPTERYRLIEGTSDSPDTQRIAADRQYGLVVVDGDHSEHVVFNELVWVESITLPGALVVVDDFGDPAWPDVEQALDRYLARPDAKLRLICTASTSAFLRAAPVLDDP